MKRKLLISALLAALVLGVTFRGTLAGYGKAALLITQVFPQIEVKPLELFTSSPDEHRITFSSPRGTVVGDLFLPTVNSGQIAARSAPAVILAMGVRSKLEDRPVMLNLARALGRLGIVVLWPRLEALDREVPLTEEPSTFIAAYRYLENVDMVDRTRIAFVGFSVGASIAFVAASDEAIAARVRSLVFFGGYYDIFDYLTDVATHSAMCNGQMVAWPVAPWVSEHVKDIFEQKGATGVVRVFAATSRQEAEAALLSAPRDELEDLRRIDPRSRVDRFKGRIFILHDEGDAAVPYCDAGRLKQALSPEVRATYLQIHIFEHVSPASGITPANVGEFGQLLAFLGAALESL